MTSNVLSLIVNGEIEEVKKYVERNIHCLHVQDSDGMTPLHVACKIGSEILVRFIVQTGYRYEESHPGENILYVNAVDKKGWTPLHWASYKQHLKICEFLLKETHCIVNCFDDGRMNTPLHILARINITPEPDRLLEVLSLLHMNGIDINARNKENETPLYISSLHGSTIISSWILNLRPKLNVYTLKSGGPIHGAIESQNHQIVANLLLCGALPSKENDTTSPMSLAQQKGFTDIAKLLEEFSRRSYEDFQSYLQSLPSSISVYNTQSHIVLKQSDELSNPWGKTILHHAVISGNFSEVEWLLKQERFKNVINVTDHPKGWNTVLYAASYGYLGITKLLVENGGAIDSVDSEGSNIMHYLARNFITDEEGLGELIILLISKTMDLDAKNIYGFTPLHEAALRNNVVVLKLLLNARLNLNILSSSGETPLILACKEGNFEVASMLIRFGANIEIKGKNGTALDYARCSNSIPLIKALLFKDYFDKNSENLYRNNCLDCGGLKCREGLDVESDSSAEDIATEYNIFHPYHIPLHLLANEKIMEYIETHFKAIPPLTVFSCTLSHISKCEKQGHMLVWKESITFLDGELEITRTDIDFSSISSVDMETFMFWSKILLTTTENLKITLSRIDEVEAHFNLLKYLHKNRGLNPLYYENINFEQAIGAILYPKENATLHRFPGLPSTETIITYFNSRFNQGNQWFSRKPVYITRNRIIFGKSSLVGVLLEDIKSIKKIADRGILLETNKNSYSFTKIEKRDWVFDVLEHYWNLKQSDNRILVVTSIGNISEDLARIFLRKISSVYKVYTRWIRHHSKLKPEDESLSQEHHIDIDNINLKDIASSLAQMRKLVIIYMEYDKKLEDIFEQLILGCKNESHFKSIVFLTTETSDSNSIYQESVISLRRLIENSNLNFTCITTAPALMQLFLRSFVKIKEEWQFRFPLGDLKVAWLDERDIIDLLVNLSLQTKDIHYSNNYFLTGSEEYSCTEVATMISEIVKQETRYYSVSLDDMRKILYSSLKIPGQRSIDSSNSNSSLQLSSPRKISVSARQNDDLNEIETYEKWFAYMLEGNTRIKSTLYEVIGQESRLLKDFFTEHIEHFKDDSVTFFSYRQYQFLENQYHEISDLVTHTIDYNRFLKALGSVLTSYVSLLPVRLFKIFDKSKVGKIELKDYLSQLSTLYTGDLREQLKLSYVFLDSDDDGVIGINDLSKTSEIMSKLLESLGLIYSASKIKALFSPYNLEGFILDGNMQYKAYLTFEEFYQVMTKNIYKIENLSMITQSKEPIRNGYQSKANLISPGHPQWDLSIIVSIGISKLLENCFPLVSLSDKISDINAYSLESTIPISSSSEDQWSLVAYAPDVFHRIRNIFKIGPAQYLYSLGFEKILSHLSIGRLSTYNVVSSSGRSGSFIWKSSDNQLILKSLPAEEYHFLRRNLQKFHEHYEKHPSTLISRIYGLYKLVSSKGDIIFFTIMSNLFDSVDIHEQYDLKGSTHNRTIGFKDWSSSHALKDMDFNRKIWVGPSMKAQLLEQFEIDTIWLEKMNICDYSLLVGLHYISDDSSISSSSIVRSKFKKDKGGILCEYPDYLNPNQKKVIYFCGLIDILTEFNLKKKGESAWKLIVHQVLMRIFLRNYY